MSQHSHSRPRPWRRAVLSALVASRIPRRSIAGGVVAALLLGMTSVVVVGASSTPALAATCTFTNYDTASGLRSNDVTGVYVNGSTIYAATWDGLSISTNGGDSFTNATGPSSLDKLTAIYGNGTTIYTVSDSYGLSISTDGGSSWSNYSTGSIAYSQVWAVYADSRAIYAGTTQGLSISTDGGANWTTKTWAGDGSYSVDNAVQGVYADGLNVYVGTRGGLRISRDGGDSWTTKLAYSYGVEGVYADGLTIYATSFNGGLEISTDGGDTFTKRSYAEGLMYSTANDVFVDGTNVFVATQGGVAISGDGGTSFQTYTTAHGLGKNVVRGMYVDGATLYVATNSNNTGSGGGLSIGTGCVPPASYTVTFDSNSGSGSMSAQSGSSSAALTANSFERSGYTFAGWNTVANGLGGTSYANSAAYGFSADVTLFAQWSAIPAPASSSSEAVSEAVVATETSPVVAPRDAAPGRLEEPAAKSAPAVIERAQQPAGSSRPAEAVALVGGEEVVVKAAAQGSQAASYGVGNVTVDVGVAKGDGAVDSIGGVPSLKIARNAPASVKGSGLQPNSTMQVFLPGSNGSFVELPSVAVAADGSFDGSLTFGTSNRAKPMPIGQRFIQMVGVDKNGNDIVLDIPVTLVQSSPAPEINRVSGQRPVLTPGQALAFNGGTPETVTLKRSSTATSLEGDGWVFTVAGSSRGDTGDTLVFTRDTPVTVSGEGFMPGTRADVWLFSEPQLLGTVDIAADGTFTGSFPVDSNFVPTGDHTLQIQGVGGDGFVKAANMGVVVQDATNTPVVPLAGDPFNAVPLLFIGTSLGGLLVLVGVTIAIGRRQRAGGRIAPAA